MYSSTSPGKLSVSKAKPLTTTPSVPKGNKGGLKFTGKRIANVKPQTVKAGRKV